MRPRTRVAFAQECGRLRSLIARAGREHLRPLPHLKTLDQSLLRKPSEMQLADTRAAHHLEMASRHLALAEQAWDDPPSSEAPDG